MNYSETITCPPTHALWERIWARVDRINAGPDRLGDKMTEKTTAFRSASWMRISRQFEKLEPPFSAAKAAASRSKRYALRGKGIGFGLLRLPILLANALGILGARAADLAVQTAVSTPAFVFLLLASIPGVLASAVIGGPYVAAVKIRRRLERRGATVGAADTEMASADEASPEVATAATEPEASGPAPVLTAPAASQPRLSRALTYQVRPAVVPPGTSERAL